MRVNKYLRNLLMGEAATIMISISELEYYGTRYTFTPMTSKDQLDMINRTRELLGLDKYDPITKTTTKRSGQEKTTWLTRLIKLVKGL